MNSISSVTKASRWGWSFQVTTSLISQCPMTQVCGVISNIILLQVLLGNWQQKQPYYLGIFGTPLDDNSIRSKPLLAFVSLWCLTGAKLSQNRITPFWFFLWVCVDTFKEAPRFVYGFWGYKFCSSFLCGKHFTYRIISLALLTTSASWTSSCSSNT